VRQVGYLLELKLILSVHNV